jgi:hypothetical protein
MSRTLHPISRRRRKRAWQVFVFFVALWLLCLYFRGYGRLVLWVGMSLIWAPMFIGAGIYLYCLVIPGEYKRGLQRAKAGLCAMCGYNLCSSGNRCPECGWPRIRPEAPLEEFPPDAWMPWHWKIHDARIRYLSWTLGLRDDQSSAWGPSEIRRQAAYELGNVCSLVVGGNSHFIPDDPWICIWMTADLPAAWRIKHHLTTTGVSLTGTTISDFLGVSVTEQQLEVFKDMNFGQVVDTLIQLMPPERLSVEKQTS